MIRELDIKNIKKDKIKELLDLLDNYQLIIVYTGNLLKKYYLISKKNL